MQSAGWSGVESRIRNGKEETGGRNLAVINLPKGVSKGIFSLFSNSIKKLMSRCDCTLIARFECLSLEK